MNNMNFVSFFRRILCMITVLALLLCITACTEKTSESIENPASSTQNSLAPSTEGSTQPAPTVPTQPSEPEKPREELIYELTEADVDAFYDLLEDCETLALAGDDVDAIEMATAALDESYELLEAQCSIAMILHYSHMSDEALETQYLDSVEICTQAHDAYMQMVKRVYLSDTPAKDVLFEGWTEQDFADLMAYNQQIAQLQQRNAEIGVAYRTTEDDDLKITLYIEFIQNNNTIAQTYGYDNYYTYAYESVYDRDYDADSVDQLRQYAKLYLGDLYDTSLTNFYYSFYENLNNRNRKALESFLFDDYDTLNTNYVQLYLDSLAGTMGAHIDTMLKYDSLFTDAYDAQEGAFTTAIGQRSFCYFGPGYASVMTVIHEGGHYYASRYADLNSIPLDLAEVHSQGNEWLFTSFLKDHMQSGPYQALVNYKLYENVATILICLMVDEFEQIVYTTDLNGFGAEDFDAIMNHVALQYFPDGDVSDMLTDMNSYWRMVVVDQPVYYISYAVSAIASISLYTAAERDYDHAMAAYQKLCQEPLLEAGFLGNITAAGLLSPFDETFYQQLQAIIEGRS